MIDRMLLVSIAIAVGCAPAQPAAAPGGPGGPAAKGQPAAEQAAAREISFFAAASTQDALETIIGNFQQLNPGIEVRGNYASSAALAEQIAAGAPADLFLSANRKWADYLAERKLVADSRDLLGNQLVVVVAAELQLHIVKPEDLTRDDIQHLALGDPESVPAGIYARQALVKLGLWDQLKDRIVAGNDVRHALAFVEEGAAEAGIVYGTDAAVSKKVKLALPLDTSLTEPIVYPLLLLNQGAENAAVRDFYRFLQSPAAAAIFQKAGFRVQQAAGVQ